MADTWRTEDHYVCTECDAVTARSCLLSAEHPFALEVGLIYGCPACREANTLVGACDREGCDHETSCGTPTPDGYRVTCGRHRPAKPDGGGE